MSIQKLEEEAKALAEKLGTDVHNIFLALRADIQYMLGHAETEAESLKVKLESQTDSVVAKVAGDVKVAAESAAQEAGKIETEATK